MALRYSTPMPAPFTDWTDEEADLFLNELKLEWKDLETDLAQIMETPNIESLVSCAEDSGRNTTKTAHGSIQVPNERRDDVGGLSGSTTIDPDVLALLVEPDLSEEDDDTSGTNLMHETFVADNCQDMPEFSTVKTKKGPIAHVEKKVHSIDTKAKADEAKHATMDATDASTRLAPSDCPTLQSLYHDHNKNCQLCNKEDPCKVLDWLVHNEHKNHCPRCTDYKYLCILPSNIWTEGAPSMVKKAAAKLSPPSVVKKATVKKHKMKNRPSGLKYKKRVRLCKLYQPLLICSYSAVAQEVKEMFEPFRGPRISRRAFHLKQHFVLFRWNGCEGPSSRDLTRTSDCMKQAVSYRTDI